MLYVLMVVSRLSSIFVEEPASITDCEYVLFSLEGFAKMLAQMMLKGRLPRGRAKEDHGKTRSCVQVGRETWCLCVPVRLVIAKSGRKLC